LEQGNDRSKTVFFLNRPAPELMSIVGSLWTGI